MNQKDYAKLNYINLTITSLVPKNSFIMFWCNKGNINGSSIEIFLEYRKLQNMKK